ELLLGASQIVEAYVRFRPELGGLLRRLAMLGLGLAHLGFSDAERKRGGLLRLGVAIGPGLVPLGLGDVLGPPDPLTFLEQIFDELIDAFTESGISPAPCEHFPPGVAHPAQFAEASLGGHGVFLGGVGEAEIHPWNAGFGIVVLEPRE